MTLKTEIDTPEMGERVREAFLAGYYRVDHENIVEVFEHGHWWITNIETGAQWSVVDAEGGPAIDGFCFERVNQGEED